MKKWLSPIVIICFANTMLSAQTREMDSLYAILNNYPKNDTVKFNLLTGIANAGKIADTKKALDMADKAIKLAQALNMPQKLARAYAVKAGVYYSTKQYPESIAWFKQAEDAYEKTQNYPAALEQYKFIGTVYGRYTNQYDQADIYLQKAIALCNRVGLKREKAPFFYGIGINWMYQNDFAKAQDNLQQCIAIAHEAGDKKIEANGYLGIGILQKTISDNARAMDAFKRSLALNEQLNDKKGIGESLNNLAVLSTSMANYSESVVYLQKAYTLNMELGFEDQAGINLNNLAYAYQYLHDYTKALECFNKELAYAKKTNNKMVQVEVLSSIANLYVSAPDSVLVANGVNATERYSIAIKYFQEYINVLRETNSTKATIREALVQLTAVYQKQKDYANALETFRKYIDVRDSIVDVDKQKEVARRESEYTFKKKEDSLSLQQQLTASQLQQQKLITTQKEQQLQLAEKERQEKELQSKYEAGIKNKQIEAQNAQLAYNKKLNVSLTIMGATLLLIATFIYYNLRKTYKLNKTISHQRDELGKQSETLAVMMKELHHRVKNNLQIVSSLLNLQSLRLTDASAIGAVQESKQRVQAMSLIHQKLYNTNDITSINMKDYIKELADFLAVSYGYNSNNFTLEINADNEWVDIDKALPLGLILNELLTNSFKYAFTGIQHPKLTVGFTRAGGNFTLEVKDNGPGIAPGRWENKSGSSFGRQLVKALCSQLRAKEKLEVVNGTSFTFTIPEAA